MNGIIMNDKVHATDKTNLEIKVSKETFTQMIQDGTLIEGATYKVTGYEDDIVISSKQVGYDNTTSQLAATNSQDAIDEINGKIIIVGDELSHSFRGDAKTYFDETFPAVKSGYKIIGVIAFNILATYNEYCTLCRLIPEGDKVHFTGFNNYNYAQDIVFKCIPIYIKS